MNSCGLLDELHPADCSYAIDARKIKSQLNWESKENSDSRTLPYSCPRLRGIALLSGTTNRKEYANKVNEQLEITIFQKYLAKSHKMNVKMNRKSYNNSVNLTKSVEI
jgi:hypothetical protein